MFDRGLVFYDDFPVEDNEKYKCIFFKSLLVIKSVDE